MEEIGKLSVESKQKPLEDLRYRQDPAKNKAARYGKYICNSHISRPCSCVFPHFFICYKSAIKSAAGILKNPAFICL